jgi:hypothetical protein
MRHYARNSKVVDLISDEFIEFSNFLLLPAVLEGLQYSVLE